MQSSPFIKEILFIANGDHHKTTAGYNSEINESWEIQCQWVHLKHKFYTQGQGRGGEKTVRARGPGNLVIVCVSQKWLPKQDLKSGNDNRHANIEG